MTTLTTVAFNLTTQNHMTTVAPSDGLSKQVIGYIAVVVAVLLFGSNLVPIKKFETGDGIPIFLCTHILKSICCLLIHLTLSNSLSLRVSILH